MKKSFENYTFLAGSSRGRGSLWQGPDHLLVVEGKGPLLPFAEAYRRIDYDKIQALAILPTQGHVWATLGLVAGVVIFGLLAFATRSAEPFLPISFGIPAVLLAVLAVVNLFRGPACRCSLQTSVQVLRLRPLVRVRQAEPVIRMLEELCRRSQASLSVAGEASVSAPAPAASPHFSGPSDTPPPGKLPWMGSYWTFSVGLCMLVWGVVLAAELFVPGYTLTISSLVLGTAAFVLGVLALVKTARFLVPAGLLVCLWMNLLVDLLAATGMYVIAIVGMVQATMTDGSSLDRRYTYGNQEIFDSMANFSMEQAGDWGWGLVVLGCLLVVLGLGIVTFGGLPRRAAPAASSETPLPPPMPG